MADIDLTTNQTRLSTLSTLQRKWSVADFGLVILIGVVIAAVYWPELVGDKVFFYFDISSMNLPARQWGFAQIKQGYFPQWCPHLGTGFPFVAESQTGIVYPVHYLTYPFLSAERAFAYDFLLHLWLAGIGMFGLFRRFVDRWPAWCGAMLWTLAGRMLVHQIHTPFLCAMSWLPINVWLIERWLSNTLNCPPSSAVTPHMTRRLCWLLDRNWLGSCMVLGLQILAGSLQQGMLNQLLIVIWFSATWLFSALPSHRFRLAIGYVTYLIVGLAFGSALLLPTLELIPQSLRGIATDESMARWGSARLQVLVDWLLPGAIGTRGNATDWLAAKLPWQELGLHYGIWAIPLAIYAAVSLRSRFTLMLTLLAIIGLIFAVGDLHPLFDLSRAIPILSSTRMPVRYSLLTGFAICGLVASALHTLANPTSTEQSRYRANWFARHRLPALSIIWLSLAGVIAVTLWLSYDVRLRSLVLIEWYPDVSVIGRSDLFRRLTVEFRETLCRAGLIIAAGMILIALANRYYRLIIPLLSSLLVCDAAWHARTAWPTIEPGFHHTPPMAGWLLKQTDSPRVFAYQQPTDIAQRGYRQSMKQFDTIRHALYWERGMMFEIGLVQPTLSIPLGLRRWFDFQSALLDSPNFLNLIAVDYVQSTSAVSGPEVASLPSFRDTGCFLYRPAKPGLKARLVAHARVIAEPDVRSLLAKSDFNPDQEVLLTASTISFDHVSPASTYSDQTKDAINLSPPTFRRIGPNQIEIEVPQQRGQTRRWLVVSETYYPGWRACNQSGSQLPIMRANDYFLAILIDGLQAQTIKLAFDSTTVKLGLLISISAGVVNLSLLVITLLVGHHQTVDAVANQLLVEAKFEDCEIDQLRRFQYLVWIVGALLIIGVLLKCQQVPLNQLVIPITEIW